MQAYIPPTEDYRFLLSHVLDFESEMSALGRDLDVDLAVTILAEAGRMCSERLQPLNRAGDEHGSVLVDGEVRTPPGFCVAYRTFAEAGWTSLCANAEHGGQGLPVIIQLWLDEMISAVNLSFGLFPGLTRGACDAIAEHAADELKAEFLPRMVSGEWTGAMALTEVDAGSDLALLKTRATPNGDGTYSVTGTKIFISSGDHDFGGNVIHLVLARLPDAQSGVKGISLFLVPKFLRDAAGAYSERNGVSVGGLENKMGLHAQPTCVMNYDGATGWLVGARDRGIAAMFTMMNAERLMVGMQGLGIAGAAYQKAVSYAQERVQGRSADGTHGPVAIIEHADVRRMLLGIRSFVEGGRALAGWTALQMERSKHHPDAAARDRADAFVALLTPVIKASFSDFGFDAAVQAQQIFGGHGYIREWGMEQHVRDARIAQIYEGTNGIQAMDLVGRKLRLKDGAVVEAFLNLVATDLDRASVASRTAKVGVATRNALELLRTATGKLQGARIEGMGAVAVDYLKLFALVSLGWMWTRMTMVARDDRDCGHVAKRAVADFFADRILPHAEGLATSIAAGDEATMELSAEFF